MIRGHCVSSTIFESSVHLHDYLIVFQGFNGKSRVIEYRCVDGVNLSNMCIII